MTISGGPISGGAFIGGGVCGNFLKPDFTIGPYAEYGDQKTNVLTV